MVYGFVKTHHRGTRQTPAILIMCGNNAIRRRAAKKKKKVRLERFFFLVVPANWLSFKEECTKHLCLKGALAREQVLLGFVYLWSGANAKEVNSKLVEWNTFFD